MSLEAEISKSNKLATVWLVVYLVTGTFIISFGLASIYNQHLLMEEFFQALQHRNVVHTQTLR